MQSAYICEEEDRPRYIEVARSLAEEYANATTSAIGQRILAAAIEELEAGRCWEAMRRIRDLFSHDDAMLRQGKRKD
jgi:flagellar protein FlbT